MVNMVYAIESYCIVMYHLDGEFVSKFGEYGSERLEFNLIEGLDRNTTKMKTQSTCF